MQAPASEQINQSEKNDINAKLNSASFDELMQRAKAELIVKIIEAKNKQHNEEMQNIIEEKSKQHNKELESLKCMLTSTEQIKEVKEDVKEEVKESLSILIECIDDFITKFKPYYIYRTHNKNNINKIKGLCIE